MHLEAEAADTVIGGYGDIDVPASVVISGHTNGYGIYCNAPRLRVLRAFVGLTIDGECVLFRAVL